MFFNKFKLFEGNGWLITSTPHCLSGLSSIQLSIKKWNANIRAHKIYHIQHILYVSESICFTDDQLNLHIQFLYPSIKNIFYHFSFWKLFYTLIHLPHRNTAYQSPILFCKDLNTHLQQNEIINILY